MGFTAMLGDGSASVLLMRKLLLLRAGLVSLKFCVCWGEDDKARTEDSSAGASQTTKDATSVFKLGKMLKGYTSLESQRVPGASISVPVSGARPGKAHHTRGLVTSRFTLYRLSVLSSRCQ